MSSKESCYETRITVTRYLLLALFSLIFPLVNKGWQSAIAGYKLVLIIYNESGKHEVYTPIFPLW